MIGIDMEKIERIQRLDSAILQRIFTESELAYAESKANKAQTLCGIYCAKEAFSKAVGSGISGFRLTDIEVSHNDLGAPILVLHNKGALNGKSANVSISHSGEYAVAVVEIN